MNIRDLTRDDLGDIYLIINEAAEVYRGVIPADRWHDPYMSKDDLSGEIAAGVQFLGIDDEDGNLVGVMGLQAVQDVYLIRHAYVLTASQGSGIGSALIKEIKKRVDRPLLVGTWAAAEWAIAFYRRHGFRQVGAVEKTSLLQRYWTIPDRQIETSVVLASADWSGT